ncbi:ketosamine-3-kinase isoform X1 [Electrophorus electricus]|uniref:protein-ribulosamine 3-kinase n=1 Tax=Electrophorus electricus TaxID=8005 RepID=A0AAY5EMY8_ELEEL|nr:ketosamine-3-kinase isoform X1 [Electrophorus electricus]XP_035380796.1 ketosamine-3-kinase isoform X1 [Electrophorus electricus]
MEALLKRELGTAKLKATGHSGGGCISEGLSYDTDFGRVFAKINYKNQARQMFDGEKVSLDAILSTNAIKAPRPMKVVDLDQGGAVFVMEHVDMRLLSRYSAQLGEQLADLHLHNKRQKEKQIKAEQTIGKGSGQSEVPVVDRFGFHVVTCCGYIPQVNDWQTDWVSFYTQQRLQHQLGLVEQAYGDREARELWASLQLKVPQLFSGVEVEPALLHGDLWSGNVAEYLDGPIIFDPASFYGHSEFELAIAGMFGGFGRRFYDAYHQKIPKAPGFEQRLKLYQLFHYLNHWNHFGSGYRGSSLRIMKDLSK